MNRILAAWFTIWSMAHAVKSMNWISTMGRMPVIAAPTPAPIRAASEMGVSRTRSGPNSSSSPLVPPNSPPKFPTSSPITKTRGSSRISVRNASAIASA